MTQTTIQPITMADLDTVTEIEQNSFQDPWDPSIFFQLALHKGRFPLNEEITVVMNVLKEKGIAIGYISWEENLHDDFGHILNLAVHRDHRQKGYGRNLLAHAFAAIKSVGLDTCELEVRESNQWARHLYETAGMKAVDRGVGYYDSEDAIIYAITFD